MHADRRLHNIEHYTEYNRSYLLLGERVRYRQRCCCGIVRLSILNLLGEFFTSYAENFSPHIASACCSTHSSVMWFAQHKFSYILFRIAVGSPTLLRPFLKIALLVSSKVAA